jgi:hypothetical protein
MYKYNVSRAAKQWGCNRVTARKLRKKFIELGWCTSDDGNMKFNNYNWTVKEKIKSHSIKLNLEDNVKKIEIQLQHALLKNKQTCFKWMEKKWDDTLNPQYREITEDDWDKVELEIEMLKKGLVPKYRFNPLDKSYKVIDVCEKSFWYLSYKKIATWFKCSASMAKKYVDRIIKQIPVQVVKKNLGFAKKRFDTHWRFKKLSPDAFWEGKPSSTNYVDFKLYSFPNGYIF